MSQERARLREETLRQQLQHDPRRIVIGADVAGLHEQLEAEGHALGRLTNQLAREVSRLLRTYKQDIIDMQLLQERIAWSAVDLYAMAAVISKLQSMLMSSIGNGNGKHDLQRDLLIGKGFCRSAGQRIKQRLHALHVNQDAAIISEADAMLGWESATVEEANGKAK